MCAHRKEGIFESQTKIINSIGILGFSKINFIYALNFMFPTPQCLLS